MPLSLRSHNWYVDRSNLDLRLNKREQAIGDEIRRSAFLGESDLCRIAVRKLLNLWDRTSEYPLPGAPADRAVLTENLRAMARELPR